MYQAAPVSPTLKIIVWYGIAKYPYVQHGSATWQDWITHLIRYSSTLKKNLPSIDFKPGLKTPHTSPCDSNAKSSFNEMFL
jgi:hypothetical protein